MATSPEAGWYTDPGDATRHRYWDGNAWTDKSRPGTDGSATGPASGGSNVKRRGRLLPISLAAGVVVAVGAAVITLAVLPDHDADPTPSATATHNTATDDTTQGDVEPITELTPWEVNIPSDWSTFVSRSGAIEYSYNPTWTDISTIISEEALTDSPELGSTQAEIAGAWMMDGSALSGGTSLTIFALSDGTVPLFLPIQTEQFASSNATAAGGTNYTVVVDAGFTTAQGYDAWRVDYTMDLYGVTAYQSVIGFVSDVTLGFIFVSSINDVDQWMPDLLSVTDSLVVVKPPVSP